MKIYDDKKFIGGVIKKARKSLRLTQSQLAEMLNMTEKNLGNIENGKQFPQINNFFRIIEDLGLAVEDFGVKTVLKEQKLKNDLLEQIYLASNNELEVYCEILKSIKKLDR